MRNTWIIYTLSDPVTNEIRYVGVTHHQGKNRLSEHISKARTKRETNHRSCWIRSLLREGLKPTLLVIEEGSGASWVDREMHWIATYKASGARLTNATDGGEGTLGWSPSPEWRIKAAERTRKRNIGRKYSTQAKENMRVAQLLRFEWEKQRGIKRIVPQRSPQTLQRMSDAQKGKILSAETRQKIGDKTRNASKITRDKWRVAMLARPERFIMAGNEKGVPKSEEHKKKIAASHQGKTLSDDTKQKISAKLKGHVQSEETKRKRAESCRLAWAQKKGGCDNS